MLRFNCMESILLLCKTADDGHSRTTAKMVGNFVQDIDQALTEVFTLQNFTNDFVEKV